MYRSLDQSSAAGGAAEGSVLAQILHFTKRRHAGRIALTFATFVEVANIQNPNDQKRILLKSNRQALADWLAEGLVKDY